MGQVRQLTDASAITARDSGSISQACLARPAASTLERRTSMSEKIGSRQLMVIGGGSGMNVGGGLMAGSN